MLGGRTAGWLAFLLVVTHTIAITLTPGYSVVPALAAALGALATLGSAGSTFLAGVLIGIAALFRHDFGVYVAVATFASLLVRGAVTRQPFARDLLRLGAGAIVIALPAYVGLAAVAGIQPMVDQLLVVPLTVIPYYRLPVLGTPYPLLLIPLAALSVAVLAVLLHAVPHPERFASRPVFLVTLLCLLGLGLFNHARTRFDSQHEWSLMIGMTPFVAAAPFVPGSSVRRAIVAAAVLGVLAVNTVTAVDSLRQTATRPSIPVVSPRASGIKIPRSYAFYNDLIQAVKSETHPGEPIFSGVLHYDRYNLNDALIHFLTDRPVPTLYYGPVRGLITTARVQKEVVHALETRRVRVLVLLDLESREPNQSSVSSGVTLLDEYIRNHFTRIGRYGPYELWRRR